MPKRLQLNRGFGLRSKNTESSRRIFMYQYKKLPHITSYGYVTGPFSKHFKTKHTTRCGGNGGDHPYVKT